MRMIRRFWSAWVGPPGNIREAAAWILLSTVEILHWLTRWWH